MRKQLTIVGLATVMVVSLAGCPRDNVSPIPSYPTSRPSFSHSHHLHKNTNPPVKSPAWELPNQKLSPGSTMGGGSFNQICPHVDQALEDARPTVSEKASVYHAYGLDYPQPTGKYELDHVIPIELGGAPNNPKNLYPEFNSTPDPAMISKWGLSPAFVRNPKDILEDALHQLVCSGRVKLSEAQNNIATNWPGSYKQYVEGMHP